MFKLQRWRSLPGSMRRRRLCLTGSFVCSRGGYECDVNRTVFANDTWGDRSGKLRRPRATWIHLLESRQNTLRRLQSVVLWHQCGGRLPCGNKFCGRVHVLRRHHVFRRGQLRLPNAVSRTVAGRPWSQQSEFIVHRRRGADRLSRNDFGLAILLAPPGDKSASGAPRLPRTTDR